MRTTVFRLGPIILLCIAPSLSGASAAPELRFRELILGSTHTCGLTQEGAAYCWGYNNQGQLGIDSIRPQTRPVPVAGDHRFVELVAAGDDREPAGYFMCGRTEAGETLCWGNNHFGQLGDGTREKRRLVPTPVSGAPRLQSLHANGFEACGVEAGGKLLCWGAVGQEATGFGELSVADSPGALPAPAELDATRFVPMFKPVGNCIFDRHGQVYCWRLKGRQLRTSAITPKDMAMRAMSLGLGLANPCGLTQSGSMYCWSVLWWDFGVNTEEPKQLAPNLRFRDFAVGGGELWALGEDGRLYRAPAYRDGVMVLQKGAAFTPVQPDRKFTALAIHPGHEVNCALTAEGEAWCWGRNLDGETGTASEATHLDEPARVVGEQRFVQLWTRLYSGACGLTAEGRAFCWGRNLYGEIGDDSRKGRRVPTPVAAPKFAR